MQSGDASLNSLLGSTTSGIVDGKLWYSNSEGVTIIDEDGERMIVDWLASNLTESYISSLLLISEDELMFYGSNGYDFNYEWWDYRRVPEDLLPEKTVVKLSYVEDGRGFFEKAAILYNQSQNEVYIEAKNYRSPSDGLERRKAMKICRNRYKTDIAAGNAGDIVCYMDYDWYETFASQGALADLTEYLENPDDIFNCVKQYCGYNDKLYAGSA